MSQAMPVPAPAIFVADAPGLDFLNSVATPVDAPVDWISDGEGFMEWLRQAGLVAPAILDDLAQRAMPGELDRVAAQARHLREWFRDFVRSRMGRPLDADGLDVLRPLNQLLERDEAYQEIALHGSEGGHRHLVLQKMRRWRSPEALLIPIGEAMARVVVEEDFTHVKACEGHNCTILFADYTRRHARRWCSMSICGNRAKVAAHRSRQKK